MKELPIYFKPRMHRAIRDGCKTEARRIVEIPKWAEPSTVEEDNSCNGGLMAICKATGCFSVIKPRYQVGDRLYVKEAWASPSINIVAYSLGAECGAWMGDGNGGRFWNHHGLILESPDYRSACANRKYTDTYGLAKYGGVGKGEYPYRYGWKSSMSMPKWATRTWLEVAGVRAERLHEITEEGARAEAAHLAPSKITGNHPSARVCFERLWESIHGEGAWRVNPWVWVYQFRLEER